ncbi:redoxin domain-containing protein [bacterium]|nr:redoxin domain-containing protein [bacterium]
MQTRMNAIAVLLLAVLLIAPVTLQAKDAAPGFALKTMDGETVKLSDYEGKVVLLNFWATWCPPCKLEIPHFIEMYDELEDDGLVILGVLVSDEPANMERYSKQVGIDYPLALGDHDVASVYQKLLPQSMRGGIPFSFIIDREGKINAHHVGYQDKQAWLNMVQPLL